MNLREQLAALYREGKGLSELSAKGGLSEAQIKRWDELKSEIEETKTKLAAQEAREKDAAEWLKGDQHFNQPAGSVARIVTQQMQHEATDNGRQGGRAVDLRGLGQRVTEHEAYKGFAKSKQGNTGKIELGSFYRGRLMGELAGSGPEEEYTLVYTGALPSSPSMIAPFRRAEIALPELPQLSVRDALTNLTTDSNTIQFWRELLFTNAGAFTIEATASGGSTGAAPESALTFEGASVPVQRLPHYIPMTEIAMSDEPRLRGVVEGRLMDGLRVVEDYQLMNGNGSDPNIRGLINVSGVQTLDNTYWGANPVQGAGNPREDFDRITRARRAIRITGRAIPSALLLSPADFERLITTTDGFGQYYAGSPFSDIAVQRMRGLMVLETETLPEGFAFILDGRQFEVYDRQQAAVTAGYINDDFVRGKLALLAEERLALAPIRPAAAAIITLTSATGAYAAPTMSTF